MPLITAYLLSFTDAATMGAMFSLGATGMLAGSILASTWRGVDHKVAGIVVSGAVIGVAVGSIGLTTSMPLFVLGVFAAMFTLPLVNSFSQAIWMAKIEPDVQGRVFATRSAIAGAAVPISLVLVGPIADQILVPLMTGTSSLGLWLQGIFGSGETAAYGLFFVTTGLAVIVMSGVAWMVGPIRYLERDVPDAMDLSSEGNVASEAAPA